MKNIILRGLSGLVYVLFILAGIIYGPGSFVAVFGLVVVLCLYEFYKLLNTKEQVFVRPAINCLAGLYFFAVTFWILYTGDLNFMLYLPYMAYVLSVLIMELYLKHPDPVQNWAYAFLGQLYIVLPLSTLNILCLQPNSPGKFLYSPVLLLALFVFIWINDTGAFFVGISMGKHRLFERVSPKKSWEGFFGGAFFTIASSFVFAHYVKEISCTEWVCLSVVTVIFATWGDLVESLLKRSLGLKDSGKMIPGHGGVLDRLDSALLAAPAMACCYYVLLL
ncbi:MAG: phosphatidate cytidylyltransferase [Dysgonamonadaceae bacterium]|jgi:phosphatidate cytidylyltransferase|nr:phosphatidate cytidylyltransferase [Dysgonamonadaceae bacterium]